MSFFANAVTDEWGTSYSLKPTAYVTIILLILICLFFASFGNRKKEESSNFSTRRLVFSAMAIALAVVTSMLKLFHLPMGGSITLFSMLFVCLAGYWYGPKTGIMASVAYGFLQLVIDPYIISLPQMFVDYIFAFGALGLAGFFHHSSHGLIKGYIAGVLGRFFFAFLSGMIFFGSYAADYNMAAPVYSLAYNGIYLGAEAVITLILISLPPVHHALARVKTMTQSE